MSAVEDTRDARKRHLALLLDVGLGVIVRTLRAELPYARLDKERQAFPLDAAEQTTMGELRRRDLIAVADGADPLRAVTLTDRGRAVLGVPSADADLPSPPPLLCDGIHNPNQPIPPAVVVCIDSTGGRKRMLLCEECAPAYALHTASEAVARYKLDRDAPPAAVYFLPLPQAWIGGP